MHSDPLAKTVTLDAIEAGRRAEVIPPLDEPIPFTPVDGVEDLINLDIPCQMRRERITRYMSGNKQIANIETNKDGSPLLKLSEYYHFGDGATRQKAAEAAWAIITWLVDVNALPDHQFDTAGDHVTATLDMLDNIAAK